MTSLTADLRHHRREAARNSPLFLAHLAGHAASRHPPVSFFRGLVVDRSGEHRDTLDVKKGGILTIVELARVHGLAAGSGAAGTLARLGDAVDDHRISASLAADLRDAWEVLCQVRLRHQVDQVHAGERPDSRIAPASLSSLEKQHRTLDLQRRLLTRGGGALPKGALRLWQARLRTWFSAWSR